MCRAGQNMPKSVVNWWCRSTLSSLVLLLPLPAEMEHPDHPTGGPTFPCPIGWPSTNGAAQRMGEAQPQPISSLTDLCPGAHRAQRWPLNTELLFGKSHIIWETATAASSLRTTFSTYASTFHSCRISIWNRNNLKTLSLVSLFTWAGLASHRETTFSILCFISVVYIPKTHWKVLIM